MSNYKIACVTFFAASLVISADAQAQMRRAQVRAAPAIPVVLNRSDADLFAATLAGRYAQGTDNPVLAAQAWSRAFMKRPGDKDLFERAIDANLQVGDIATAVRLSKMVTPALRSDYAALALAVDAFAQGRHADVTTALAGRTFPPSLRIFVEHLSAYALLGQNKPSEAVDVTSRATGIQVLDKASLISRAIVLELAGRGPEAGILYQSALDSNVTWPIGVRTYGDWLVTNDRKADAISMYRRLVRAGGLEASGFAAALVKIETQTAPQVRQDLRAHAASGLITIAQSLAAEGRGGAPIILFNLTAHLDTRSDGVAVALANQLISEERGDIAKPLLAKVTAASPDYLAARRELVWLAFKDDQNAAVSLARETKRAMPNDNAASRLLADVLAANRNDSEAEALYSALINKSKAAGQSDAEAWPLYFGRGGSRERQGNWAGALADLRLAKTAAPNQPNVLNYLGYALADRGENIDEAIAMLRTAVRLRPRSGSIQDSLGWGLFKAGRYEDAVSILENAASLSPALAEISDHLGDAYWRSGREDEARMEWARALRLETTQEQKLVITTKLRDGMPPDPALAARRALASQSGSAMQR